MNKDKIELKNDTATEIPEKLKKAFDILTGKKVVITFQNIIYTGTFCGFERGKIVLSDCEIKGSKHIVFTKSMILTPSGAPWEIHLAPDNDSTEIKNKKECKAPDQSKKNTFDILLGKIVTIATNNSNLIYTGTLCGFERGKIILSDCEIKGSKHIVSTKLAMVYFGNLKHIHLIPDEIREVKSNKKQEKY